MLGLARTVAMSLSAASLLAAPSALASNQQTLLLPGSYHGYEVTAKSGERWLAYIPETHAIRSVRLRIDLEKDEIEDSGKTKTGKRVSTTDKLAPLFLVKNLPYVRAGSATNVAFAGAELNGGRSVALPLNKRNYRLEVKVITRADKSNSYQLILSDGVRKQIIKNGTNPDFSTSSKKPTLLWAGDLDSDGRLDLLIDTSDNYNATSNTLYLSKGAGGGKLVRPVAVLMTVGC